MELNESAVRKLCFPFVVDLADEDDTPRPDRDVRKVNAILKEARLLNFSTEAADNPTVAWLRSKLICCDKSPVRYMRGKSDVLSRTLSVEWCRDEGIALVLDRNDQECAPKAIEMMVAAGMDVAFESEMRAHRVQPSKHLGAQRNQHGWRGVALVSSLGQQPIAGQNRGPDKSSGWSSTAANESGQPRATSGAPQPSRPSIGFPTTFTDSGATGGTSGSHAVTNPTTNQKGPYGSDDYRMD